MNKKTWLRGSRGTWRILPRLPRITIITILSFLILPLPALAAPLVADLSNYRIDITSGFNGTRLFLFGARNDTGDIVVVVRGPQKNYVVRKKENIAGIWINREHMKFYGVPDFYAIATSKALPDIEQANMFRQLGIGQDNLLIQSPGTGTPAHFHEFSDAFLRYQQERRLYMKEPEAIGFMGETLFKTMVEFPDDIPPGDYTAEIYLFSDGEISGMQSTPIRVVKSGLDAFLFGFAHNSPTLYGLVAVFLALGIGWLASRAFEKI